MCCVSLMIIITIRAGISVVGWYGFLEIVADLWMVGPCCVYCIACVRAFPLNVVVLNRLDPCLDKVGLDFFFGLVFAVVAQEKEIVGGVNLGFVGNGRNVVIGDKVGFDLGGEGEDSGRSRVDNTDGGSSSHGKGGSVNDGEEGLFHSVLGHNINDLLVVITSLDQLDAGVQRTSIGFEHDLDGFDSVLKLEGFDSIASVNNERLSEIAQGLDNGSLSSLLFSTSLGILDIGDNTGTHVVFHGRHVANGNRVVLVGGFQDSREGVGVSIIGSDLEAHGSGFGSLPDLDGGGERNSLVVEHDGNTVNVVVHNIPGLEALSSLNILDTVGRGKGFECSTNGTQVLGLSSLMGGLEVELLESSNDGLGHFFGRLHGLALGSVGSLGGLLGHLLESIEVGGLGKLFFLEFLGFVDLVVQGSGSTRLGKRHGGKGRSGEGLLGEEGNNELVGDLHVGIGCK